jgi:hypothetical protein
MGENVTLWESLTLRLLPSCGEAMHLHDDDGRQLFETEKENRYLSRIASHLL